MIERKLKDLKVLENNPRKIENSDLDKLETSIKKFGIIKGRPFLLSNRTGELVIIGGNQRYKICKKLGINEVPTELLEGLSEEDEKEIIIRDNISNGDWDFDLLNSDDWEQDLLIDWGIDIPEIKDIDFDNIESNEDRGENTKKVNNIICPKCDHSFII